MADHVEDTTCTYHCKQTIKSKGTLKPVNAKSFSNLYMSEVLAGRCVGLVSVLVG